MTFRSRVFRLLLLFAAVPSIALTMIGYYLALDPYLSSEQMADEGSDDVEDYFYDLLYKDITLAVNDWSLGSPTNDPLDFALRFDSASTHAKAVAGGISSEAVARLREAAGQQSRGLIAVQNQFYQYVSIRTSEGEYLIGGIVHDSSLATVLAAARRGSATRSAERELRATYAGFLALLFLTVTTLTIIAAYLMSSRVSKNLAEPVMALSRASQRIADGDFKQKVTLSAEAEMGMLIASFNRMAAQLDQATSRLAQTERVAAWRQVARRFAHELKNPLQPILVSLYRLEQQLVNTGLWDQVKDPLRAASEEVKHLTVLAERFSSLAKLPPPIVKSLDLSELVSSTVELYREKLQPFVFELSLPERPVVIAADASYLREALHNLLQNGIDACLPGDRIKVDVVAGDDVVRLVVSDTGKGMDEATLSSARLPYFTTKTKGNGLGLAIVERSMAELGGQLEVESTEGKGTRVTIVLPRGNG